MRKFTSVFSEKYYRNSGIFHKKQLQNKNAHAIILRVPARARYIGMSPSGKAPDFDSGIRRFKSCHPSQ